MEFNVDVKSSSEAIIKAAEVSPPKAFMFKCAQGVKRCVHYITSEVVPILSAWLR
jgi:hypothetical protein